MEGSRLTAAEARRQKLLARGTERLKQITGELPKAQATASKPVSRLLARQRALQHDLDVQLAAGDAVARNVVVEQPVPLNSAAGTAEQRTKEGNQYSANAEQQAGPRNEVLAERQRKWSAYSSPLGGKSRKGTGVSAQHASDQKLRLAIGATHVPRLLASALFACLCFRFLGAPVPQSKMFRALWFVVNSMPPVLGLCSVLVALILRAYVAFQLSPTLLKLQADRQVIGSKGIVEGLLEKILPGLRGPVENFMAAIEVLRSIGDGLAVYFVTLCLLNERFSART